MTTSLRSRLSEPGAVVALGAHDGLTARIAERAGVEALYHGGYALAAHHFGAARTSVSSAAPRSSRACAACAAATDLPIIVDADTGYGSEAGRLAHGARARGGRRQRGPDRGPGLARSAAATWRGKR